MASRDRGRDRTRPRHEFADVAFVDGLSGEEGEGDGWEVGFDEALVDAIWVAASNIKDGSGDASILRLGAQAAMELEYEDWLQLGLGAGYQYENWQYSGRGSGLVPNADRPWSGFDKFGVELSVGALIDDSWAVYSEVGLEWAGEIDGTTSDEMLAEGLFAVRKRFSDNFDLTLGAFYGQNHESSADILPLVGFDWRITDRDRLRLDRPRAGYGLTYTRTMTDDLDLSTFLVLGGESYRLRKNGPVPGGAVESTERLLGVSADWRVGPGALSATGGYAFSRDYEVFSSSGRSLADRSLDGGVFFGLAYEIGY